MTKKATSPATPTEATPVRHEPFTPRRVDASHQKSRAARPSGAEPSPPATSQQVTQRVESPVARQAVLDSPSPSHTAMPPAVHPEVMDRAEEPARQDVAPRDVPLAAVQEIPHGMGAAADAPSAALLEQLELHAEQLAAFLRQRQRSLDQREGELNACAAQWEQEIRASRLEMDETRHRLNAWQKDLQEQQAALDQATASLAAAELANEQTAHMLQQRLREREDALNAREAALLEQEARCQRAEQTAELSLRKVETARQELHRSEQLAEQRQQARKAEWQRLQWQLLRNLERHERQAAGGPSIDTTAPPAEPVAISPTNEGTQPAFRQRQELDEREQHVRDAETRMAERQGQLERQWQELQTERDAWMQERSLRDQRAAAWLATQQESLKRERARLETLAEHARRLQASAGQAQQEARRVHGESLELRLAAEQLWHLVAEVGDPAQAASRLAQLRSRISSYFAEERRQLTSQADRLREAARQLAGRHEELLQEKERWQQRLARQRHELEVEAARLVAREQELRRSGSRSTEHAS